MCFVGWKGISALFLLTFLRHHDGGVRAENEKTFTQLNFTIETREAEPLTAIVGDKTPIHFSYSSDEIENYEHLELCISVDSDSLVDILSDNEIKINGVERDNISVVLKGKLPGRTRLIFQASWNGERVDVVSYSLFVERRQRTIDTAFTAVIILLVVLANIGMGCKVDLNVVKATLKRPVAPAIGLSSQFIFMPLIGFVMAYTLPLEPGAALGFLALGCSPGGSASNMYTNFLKGNLSLSVTMTLISSLAALGMIPLWLFTLGQLIYAKGKIKIPFTNILTSLIGIIIPIIIGLFLQRKLPKAANFFIKAVKYIIVVFFIFVFSVGIYANLYIFYLITPEILLASALMPYLGFIFGGLFAFVTRQKKGDIIAISLETGIQNTGIPIILCQLSLSGPDKDTSLVSPIISAIFTPIPVMFAILYVQCKAWRERKARANQLENNPDARTTEAMNKNCADIDILDHELENTRNFSNTTDKLMEAGDS